MCNYVAYNHLLETLFLHLSRVNSTFHIFGPVVNCHLWNEWGHIVSPMGDIFSLVLRHCRAMFIRLSQTCTVFTWIQRFGMNLNSSDQTDFWTKMAKLLAKSSSCLSPQVCNITLRFRKPLDTLFCAVLSNNNRPIWNVMFYFYTHKTKCLQVLFYALDVCPVNRDQIRSLDHAVHIVLEKNFQRAISLSLSSVWHFLNVTMSRKQ